MAHLHAINVDNFPVYLLDTKFLKFIIRLDHTVKKQFHLQDSGLTKMINLKSKSELEQFYLLATSNPKGKDRQNGLAKANWLNSFVGYDTEGDTVAVKLAAAASTADAMINSLKRRPGETPDLKTMARTILDDLDSHTSLATDSLATALAERRSFFGL